MSNNVILKNEIDISGSIKNYREKGFCVIKNVFIEKLLNSLWENLRSKNFLKSNKNVFIYYQNNENTKNIRRIEGLFDSLDNIRLYHQFIIKILGNIQESPIIFKDKLNIKNPGKGSGFRAHIDGHFYFPIEINGKLMKKEGWRCYSSNFVNVLIPLLPMNEENGCLEIATIKQTHDILGESFKSITHKLGGEAPFITKKLENKFEFEKIIAKVGDLILFDWKCLHRSADNHSSQSRPAFYLTYADSHDKEIRFKYYQDKKLSKNSFDAKSLK